MRRCFQKVGDAFGQMRVSKALLECSTNKQGRDITLTLSPMLLGSGGNGNAFVVKYRQNGWRKRLSFVEILGSPHGMRNEMHSQMKQLSTLFHTVVFSGRKCSSHLVANKQAL